MDQLDQNLLSKFACLKALNFWHIAYLGKELDHLSKEKSNKILWHEEKPHSDESFKWLKSLCDKRWIVPWRVCSPDHILTNPMGRSTVRKEDTFYILGKTGRKILLEMGLVPPTMNMEELYFYSVPIGQWLTASSCALALESNGAKLTPLKEVWTDDNGIPKPAFYPDFVITQDYCPISFYICSSPFIQNSEYFVAHVGRAINHTNRNGIAVILTRTKEAFVRIMCSMMGGCLNDHRHRVFVGDLGTFKDYHLRGDLWKLKFFNADGKSVQLIQKPVSILGVPDDLSGTVRFGSLSSSRPVKSLHS